MKQTATLQDARALAHLLHSIVPVKPETHSQKTSGIYIPKWKGVTKVPHAFDKKTGKAEWFFHLRFVHSGLADLNVGEALEALRYGFAVLVLQKSVKK